MHGALPRKKPENFTLFPHLLPAVSQCTGQVGGAEKPEQDEKKKDGVEGQPKSGDVDDAEGREKDAAGGREGGGSDVNRCHGDGAMGAVFLCPTCRAPVTVPEGGVAALQVRERERRERERERERERRERERERERL